MYKIKVSNTKRLKGDKVSTEAGHLVCFLVLLFPFHTFDQVWSVRCCVYSGVDPVCSYYFRVVVMVLFMLFHFFHWCVGMRVSIADITSVQLCVRMLLCKVSYFIVVQRVADLADSGRFVARCLSGFLTSAWHILHWISSSGSFVGFSVFPFGVLVSSVSWEMSLKEALLSVMSLIFISVSVSWGVFCSWVGGVAVVVAFAIVVLGFDRSWGCVASILLVLQLLWCLL